MRWSSNFFFLQKWFRLHKKHQNAKQLTLNFLEVFVREKLLPLLFSVCSFSFCWLVLVWFTFLYVQNFFVKKINWLEIVLIISLTILLTCTPINSPIENLFVHISFYLWSSVSIFSYLWSTVWIYGLMKISKRMNTII